ncbi:hypothetical protein HMPREF9071_0343 [Capnocytophaga sp. oral taxon 338 str. F0234]|nr:hypothetical protein HMPREF9071_0343 [Capnocytophaga sp. oral taxon 338 str. F0234]
MKYRYKKIASQEAIPFLTNKFQYYETMQRYDFFSNPNIF